MSFWPRFKYAGQIQKLSISCFDWDSPFRIDTCFCGWREASDFRHGSSGCSSVIASYGIPTLLECRSNSNRFEQGSTVNASNSEAARLNLVSANCAHRVTCCRTFYSQDISDEPRWAGTIQPG